MSKKIAMPTSSGGVIPAQRLAGKPQPIDKELAEILARVDISLAAAEVETELLGRRTYDASMREIRSNIDAVDSIMDQTERMIGQARWRKSRTLPIEQRRRLYVLPGGAS